MTLEDQQHDCLHCSKRFSSVFCRAELEHIQEINDSKICSSYKKGQTIFNEGAYPFGLFCINAGKIKISKNGDDGRDIIVRLAKPGDIIGYKALLTAERYSASAVAIDDCDVCFIPKDLFLRVLKTDANLSLELIKMISSELNKVEMKVAHLAQKPVRERVAETLLFIKETYGLEADQITLNVRLSRDEIANIVGTATESAIRILSEFKKEGIISLDGKKIGIIDHSKLIRVANLQD